MGRGKKRYVIPALWTTVYVYYLMCHIFSSTNNHMFVVLQLSGIDEATITGRLSFVSPKIILYCVIFAINLATLIGIR